MSVEGASHRLIDRPAGIPGYLPRQWCAVCGLKITDTIRSQRCIERGCPNISHTACLDNEPEFNCANTQELRVRVGIRGQVTFRPPQVTPEPVRSTPLRPSVSVEEEDLVDLTREELTARAGRVTLCYPLPLPLLVPHCHITLHHVTPDHVHNPPPRAPPPRAPPTRNSPTRNSLPQYLPPSLVHPIRTQPDQRPQTVRGNKHYPQGSSHQWSSQGRRRPPRGQIHNNTVRVTEERPTSERLPQIRCSLCHRKDHSEEQCPKHLTCEYCQGRFHTERTCKERQADRRHQDLIQAVRLGSQETLAVLRGAAWHLPSQQLNNTWGTRPTPGVGLYNSHYPYHQGVSFPQIPTPHSNAYQWHQEAPRAL
ncbi:hypothetical protein Pcinc_036689 [Petrolisthes cinctipes]|uniref:Uncharacterized protein n=1 Tax=Petrolisthes cinctipes TaxID=88211 RepID=A0AAE1BXE9_PETCI|nr:hypothetical protein Pcinc_036689 [Petrolisthes cinctipes]